MDLHFPGVAEPTVVDQIGADLADEQLDLIDDLKAIRTGRGMSVIEVAKLMKVDPSQVSRFESGSTNPTMSTIRRYAKAVRAVFHIETERWEDYCTHTVAERADVTSLRTWETGEFDPNNDFHATFHIEDQLSDSVWSAFFPSGR